MFKLFQKAKDPVPLARQNKELNARLTAVAEVNKSLVGVIDKQKVFDLITKKLAASVKMNFPSIWIYDEKNESISLASHSIPTHLKFVAEKAIGKNISELAFYKSNKEEAESTYFKVIETGKPIYSHNLYEHTRPFLNQGIANILEKMSGMQLAVSVPILVEDKAIGVLSAIWQEKELSTENSLTLFTFANQIATAIYNSQQYEDRQIQISRLKARNSDLQGLYSLSSTISKTLDPQEVAQSAVNLLNAQEFIIGGTLSLYDEKKGVSTPIAITENELSKRVIALVGDISLLTTKVNDPVNANDPEVVAFKTGIVQHTNSLVEYLKVVLPVPVIKSLEKFLHIKSVSIYPLKVHGKVVGTLAYYLKDKTYRELEPNRQQLLDTYSLQIGIALENASLYAEAKDTQAKLKKTNTSLEEAVNALKESRRRERDMLDVMGHELRTPISIVRNALLMLDREHKKHDLQDEEIVKYLSMAIESTRREIFLIETLLSATKVDGSRIQLYFEQVGMKDVITDAIEAQSSTLHTKGLKLAYTPPHNDTFVYADRTRTQEIMDNLFSNAIKYTTKGEVKISLWQDDKFGWLSITDSGMGISPEDLQQLGHKFFRAKQYVPNDEHGADALKVVRPGGTGLGLYVTFELVGSMEGQLYINSEVGKGSTFTFGLPLFTNQKPKQLDQTFDPHKHKDHSHIFIGKDAPMQS